MSLAMSLEARATRALTVRARRSANGSGTVGAVGPLARRATRARASAGEGSEDAPPRAQPNPNQMLVLVPPHPLLKHWLGWRETCRRRRRFSEPPWRRLDGF